MEDIVIQPLCLYHSDNGTLHLLDVQWDAAGEYLCTAENAAGRDQRSTMLSIYAGRILQQHSLTLTGMHNIVMCYFFLY